MKIKRLLNFGSAFVLSLSTLLTLSIPLTSAASYECTWTGGGGVDTNFSNAANWSGCNSAAPQASDTNTLIFPFDTAATFEANNDLTAGTTFAQITFEGAATEPDTAFYITGNAFTLALDITMASTAVGTGALIENDIALTNTNHFLYVNDADAGLILSGQLSTAYALTKDGPGYLYLDGDNSGYTGDFQVAEGTVVAGNENAIGTSSAPGATIQDGTDFIISSCGLLTSFNSNLDMTGDSTLTTGDYPAPKFLAATGGCGLSFGTTIFGYPGSPDATTNIDINGDIVLGSDITFAGTSTTTTLNGDLSGAFGITMLPGYTGKLVVAGATNTTNTANGTYTSELFTKTLSDTLPSDDITIFGNNVITVEGERGNTEVLEGGILKGNGTVADLYVDEFSTVAPGNSPGCLTSSGLTLLGTFEAELGGTTACTDYDQIIVNGTVDVTDGTLTPSLYNGFVPTVGQSYTVINNDGSDAVTGTFAGIAQGGTITNTGVTYSVSYTGGDGNDVVITVTAVDASALPTSPSTGFGMLTGNPLLVLGATTTAALGLFTASRRLKTFGR